MGRRVKFSPRDRVRNLTQPGRFSNRSLAAAIGVSEKTIRRVKSGERKLDPSRFAPEVFETLNALDREVRSVLKSDAKQRGIRLPPLKVIPPFERGTRIDPFDPEGKARIDSDTIDYDLDESEEDLSEEITDEGRELLTILKHYRDVGSMTGALTGVRFLVSTYKYDPKGTQKMSYWWPTRATDQPDISEYTDEELRDLIVEVFLDVGLGGQVHKVRVVDGAL